MKYYLIVINAVGLVLMLLDKRFAVRHARRIPEKTLFAVAILGGSLGVYLGMWLAHHKTKKPRFTVGIPLILAAQVAAYWLIVPK